MHGHDARRPWRVVSYGACLVPINTTMTAGNYVAANGQVRWYFGDLQRNTLALEPAG